MPRVVSLTHRLAIWVFANDHAPPHFHLMSPDTDVLIDMRTCLPIAGTYRKGDLAAGLVWASRPDNLAILQAKWSMLNERD